MKICVFGASGSELEHAYFDAAHELGSLLAAGGHSLIFGGGADGLMGAAAKGAASMGGEIIGVAPRFFDEPGVLFPGCTEFIFTETMAERKSEMERLADAFVILPGGIGTFEEFFEVLTLKQLGRHGKPMALLNTLNYYDAMTALLRRAVDGGFLSRGCFSLYTLCDTPKAALDAVLHAETVIGSIRRLADYTK